MSGGPHRPPPAPSPPARMQHPAPAGVAQSQSPCLGTPRQQRGAGSVGLGLGGRWWAPPHLVPHDVRQRLPLHHHGEARRLPFLSIDVLHDGLKARRLCREMGRGAPWGSATPCRGHGELGGTESKCQPVARRRGVPQGWDNAVRTGHRGAVPLSRHGAAWGCISPLHMGVGNWGQRHLITRGYGAPCSTATHGTWPRGAMGQCTHGTVLPHAHTRGAHRTPPPKSDRGAGHQAALPGSTKGRCHSLRAFSPTG